MAPNHHDSASLLEDFRVVVGGRSPERAAPQVPLDETLHSFPPPSQLFAGEYIKLGRQGGISSNSLLNYVVKNYPDLKFSDRLLSYQYLGLLLDLSRLDEFPKEYERLFGGSGKPDWVTELEMTYLIKTEKFEQAKILTDKKTNLKSSLSRKLMQQMCTAFADRDFRKLQQFQGQFSQSEISSQNRYAQLVFGFASILNMDGNGVKAILAQENSAEQLSTMESVLFGLVKLNASIASDSAAPMVEFAAVNESSQLLRMLIKELMDQGYRSISLRHLEYIALDQCFFSEFAALYVEQLLLLEKLAAAQSFMQKVLEDGYDATELTCLVVAKFVRSGLYREAANLLQQFEDHIDRANYSKTIKQAAKFRLRLLKAIQYGEPLDEGENYLSFEDGAIHFQVENSAHLFMVFLGFSRGNNAHILEIWKKLAIEQRFSIMFIYDIHHMGSLNGIGRRFGNIQGSQDLIAKFIEKYEYKHIHTIGNSVTGFAALSYAFSIEARTCLSFSGGLFIPKANTDGRDKYSQVNAVIRRIERGPMRRKSFLEEFDKHPNFRVWYVFGKQNEMDAHQASFAKNISNIKLFPVDTADHNVMKHLIQHDRSEAFLARYIEFATAI